MKQGGSRCKRSTTRDRTESALELRLAGCSFSEIAEKLGYTDAGRARSAVKAALKRAAPEPGADLLLLEVERLNQLLAAVWPRALDGDEKAIDRALKIMTQRARLLGLNAKTNGGRARNAKSVPKRTTRPALTNEATSLTEDCHDLDHVAGILTVLEEAGVIPTLAPPMDAAARQ